MYFNMQPCTAVYCNEPPDLTGASRFTPDSTGPNGSYTYGAISVYSCLSGMRFEDGRPTTRAFCGPRGQWMANVNTCGGILMITTIF